MTTPREGSFDEQPHEAYLDDAANDYVHLTRRPHGEADGYVCDTSAAN